MRTTLGRISVLAIFLVTISIGAIALLYNTNDALMSASPTLHIEPIGVQHTSAKAYVVFDPQNGRIIAAHNASNTLPMASVTKLFTANAFRANADLEALTTITATDVATEGGAGKLHTGQTYANNDLLYPLLLESSNDAAVAMTHAVPDLIAHMQLYAFDHGLSATHFSDSSGLSPQNVSSARDLSVMASDIYQHQPHLIDITQLRQYVGPYTGWLNNDPFSGQSDYRGGKHGWTPEAHHTGVFFFADTLKNGETHTFGYVLLYSDNLKGDIDTLRNAIREHVSYQ